MLAVAKKLPELLKHGLKVYKTLKTDMEKALGLQEYAKKLEQINQVMDGVRKFLSEEEKNIADILVDAHDLTQKGLQKAVVVVNVIKSQSEALLGVLNPSITRTTKEQKDKLYMACVYFAQFAKDIEVKVIEAEDALLDASNKLYSARSKIVTITNTLKRIQDELVDEVKKAKAQQRAAAYGGAAVGLIAGPIGLIISYSVAAGITEGHTIKQLEKNFQEQRQKVDKYIDEFNNMKNETDSLKNSIDEKRAALTEIHGKLSATSSVAKTEWDVIESFATVHFNTVHDLAKDLCEACKAFLESVKF